MKNMIFDQLNCFNHSETLYAWSTHEYYRLRELQDHLATFTRGLVLFWSRGEGGGRNPTQKSM